eukprot:gene21017-23069_t
MPKADILFSKGCEVLVIGFNSNKERGSLRSYSPHGSIGKSFLKEEAGQYVVKLFKQCIEKKSFHNDSSSFNYPDFFHNDSSSFNYPGFHVLFKKCVLTSVAVSYIVDGQALAAGEEA